MIALSVTRFSALDPHTWLKPHCGHTNAQLKMHLGLIVPRYNNASACALFRVGEETRAWEQGEVMFFDDSFEHEVRLEFIYIERVDSLAIVC